MRVYLELTVEESSGIYCRFNELEMDPKACADLLDDSLLTTDL